jgi:2-polyprenyl-6-methoxyphenol hydroxylase-like FAD-dependent oxidoreductase
VIQRELLARYGRYYEPIPSLIARTRLLIRLNVYDLPSLPTWRQGRVILIGHAAHAVSPNAGQGASLALEDALYLAKRRRDTPGGHAVAFERFERDRKPRAEKVVAEGRRRAADKELVSPLRARIRELIMRILIPLRGEKSQERLLGYRVPHDP